MTMLNVIELSDKVDNSTVLANYVGQTVSVTLRDRTVYKDGDWNTLCLPFDVTVGSDVMEDATAMTLNASTSNYNASTGVLTLNFDNVAQNSTITAGTPFIVKWDNTEDTELKNPVFSGVTVSGMAAGGVVSDDKNVRFLGTYSPAQIYSANHDNLFLGAENKLYWPSTEGYTLGSYRAYFHLDLSGGAAAVRQFVLNFGDAGSADDSSASGIAVISPASVTDADVSAPRWYTIDGVRLDGKPTKKGVYIKNGRKVIVR